MVWKIIRKGSSSAPEARTNAVHSARESCQPRTDNSEACFIGLGVRQNSGEPTAKQNLPLSGEGGSGQKLSEAEAEIVEELQDVLDMYIKRTFSIAKTINGIVPKEDIIEKIEIIIK